MLSLWHVPYRLACALQAGMCPTGWHVIEAAPPLFMRLTRW